MSRYQEIRAMMAHPLWPLAKVLGMAGRSADQHRVEWQRWWPDCPPWQRRCRCQVCAEYRAAQSQR